MRTNDSCLGRSHTDSTGACRAALASSDPQATRAPKDKTDGDFRGLGLALTPTAASPAPSPWPSSRGNAGRVQEGWDKSFRVRATPR